MAVVVTNIGSATGTGSATITVGAGGVPAGSTIVVITADLSDLSVSGGPGLPVDTSGNTYGLAQGAIQTPNGVLADGFVAGYYAFGVSALSNGNTIVYASAVTGKAVAIAAFYATGLITGDPADNALTTLGNTGSSTSPSSGTSGPPTGPGELFVGAASSFGTLASTTQAAGWSTPPGQVNIASPGLIAGTQINAGSGALTYAPTFGTSRPWAAIIFAFQVPAVTGPPPPFLPVEPDAADFSRYTVVRYGISLRSQGEVWQNILTDILAIPPPFQPLEPDTHDYVFYYLNKYGISLRAQGEVWQNVFPLYFGDAVILMGQTWM